MTKHCFRIKKWSMVRDQIPLHNFRQKHFVVYGARGNEHRLSDNEFSIVGKLSA